MIAIIQACGSNIASLEFALARLGVTAELTNNAQKIQTADYVILPGVGNAKHAMQTLEQYKLIDVIQHLNQPVLGICLGMQLLFESSEEGNTNCLGILPGRILRFSENNQRTVPHMGWNSLQIKKSCLLLNDIVNQSYQYFVHSYFAPINENTIAAANYGGEFSALVQKGNFFGAQFHPEKSGKTGSQILKNFLNLALPKRALT